MPENQSRRSPSFGKRVLRGIGLALGVALAVVVGAVIYLNLAGFPEWAKRKIQQRLEARGFELTVERLKLRGISRLHLEGLTITPADTGSGSGGLSLEEAEIDFHYLSLLGGDPFQPSAVHFRKAKFVWPLFPGQPSSGDFKLELENSEIEWPSESVIRIAPSKGWFNGAQIEVSATVTNLANFREWRKEPSEISGRWEETWREWARGLSFASSSVIRLKMSGDAAAPETFRMQLDLEIPWVETPVGRWRGVHMQAGLSPSGEQTSQGNFDFKVLEGRIKSSEIGAGSGEGEFHFSIRDRNLKQARWQIALKEWNRENAKFEEFAFSGTSAAREDGRIFSEAEMSLGAVWAETGTAGKTLAEFQAEQPSLAQLPDRVNWRWAGEGVGSQWGRAEEVRASGELRRIGPLVKKVEGGLGYWSYAAPFEVEWTGEVVEFHGPETEVAWVGVEGSWRWPDLLVRKFNTRLYGGTGQATARLNVLSRQVDAAGEFDFDVHGIASWLTPNSRRWLSQFTWEKPPRVQAHAGLVLPAWENSRKEWRQGVLPTVTLDGRFEGSGGAFRGVPVSAARSDFQLTNLVWNLPNLVVARPEGESTIAYRGNMATRDYAWQFRSEADPRAIKPLFEESQQHFFDLVHFYETPAVEGEVWGRWGEPELTGFLGRVEARDFLFREERCDLLRAGVQFTNLLLHLTSVRIEREGQRIEAPEVLVDFAAMLFLVKNGISTFDPGLVTKVIGPKVHRSLQPYQFHEPPTVRVDGIFPIKDLKMANARFQVAGPAFSFWKFNVPHISGDILWKGETVSFSQVRASFYEGSLEWEGEFDFTPLEGADLRFRGSVSGAELKLLIDDLLPRNQHRVAGQLHANFVLRPSNTAVPDSWRGFGNVSLHDGFLWDIPIFGFFSEVLNRISPGLGNSPVSSGSASFVIENQLVGTRDLELRSPALRLAYQGQVSFDGEVNARMEAEILRDALVFGRVLSLLFRPLTKAFEYQITGSIFAPQSEPIHIPRAFMRILRPIRTLRDLFSGRRGEEDEAPIPISQVVGWTRADRLFQC